MEDQEVVMESTKTQGQEFQNDLDALLQVGMALEDQVSSPNDFIAEQIVAVNKSKKLVSWKRRAGDKFSKFSLCPKGSINQEILVVEAIKQLLQQPRIA